MGILPMFAGRPTFTTKRSFTGWEARSTGHIATGSEKEKDPPPAGRLGRRDAGPAESFCQTTLQPRGEAGTWFRVRLKGRSSGADPTEFVRVS